MGYDYRGGNTSGGSRAFASYLEDIKRGNTRSQRDRDLKNRVMVTGIQAGVGALGHAIEGEESKAKHEEALQRRFMAHQIESQTRQAGFRDQIGRENSALGYADDSQPVATNESVGHIPEWLKSQGAVAIGNAKLNDAASMNPVGGYATPEGMDALHNDASALNRDQDLIESWGGMSNSLQRTR